MHMHFDSPPQSRAGIHMVFTPLLATVYYAAAPMIPGDPAELLLTQGGAALDPVALDDPRRKLGHDQPLLLPYLDAMGRLLRGDLGARRLGASAGVGSKIRRNEGRLAALRLLERRADRKTIAIFHQCIPIKQSRLSRPTALPQIDTAGSLVEAGVSLLRSFL